MKEKVGTIGYEAIMLKLLWLIEKGDISVLNDFDIDEEDLCTLALGAYYSCKYKAAEALFALLQTNDNYANLAAKYLKLICKGRNKKEEHLETQEDVKQHNALLPGYIVTVSGIDIKCAENEYRPSFSKTKDSKGTKYLIFKIDYDKKIVYALPLSEVEDNYMYMIRGRKYDTDVPDRWAEAIVRVFSISAITNIAGRLSYIDYERTLASANNSFVFAGKGHEIPNYATSFVEHMVEKRKKEIKPGFLIEYKDYSDKSYSNGRIRSFYVFAVAGDKYRTFEMVSDSKKRYNIKADCIFEIPKDFKLSTAYMLSDKSLKTTGKNMGEQFGKNSGTPIKFVVSPLEPCKEVSSKNKEGFRIAPAGEYPGINNGTRELKITN